MSPAASLRVRARVALLLALVALAMPAVPAVAADRDPARPLPGGSAWDTRGPEPGRLVVTFDSGVSAADARGLEDGDTELVSFDRNARRAIYHTPRTAVRAEQRRLERDPSVRSAHVSHRLYRDADPDNEQFWQYLWGLHNTGQSIRGVTGSADVDIDARQSLATSTGSGVVVAVIDDGIDFSLPDLAGQAWVNPGESGGGKETNGVDDDGNGYVDDVNGWDFCHDDRTVHDVDDDFHGTHVAGTIAAKLDGTGVVGVAPGVKLMALKFLGDDLACGWDDQAIEAIAYAKSFGVRISNNSWGRSASFNPSDDAPLRSAIEASGMLFVASAGNSGVNNDTSAFRAVPASFDLANILSVAALDNRGNLAGFSNYGATTVDVAAPGVDIASTLPAYDGNPAGHYYLSGTSMAAPHVAGVAAVAAVQTPSLLNDTAALKQRILNTAKVAAKTAGRTLTGDIVSAMNALDTVPPTMTPPNSYAFVTGKAIGSSITTRVRWSAGSDDLSGVASYALRQSVNGSAWTTVTASTTKLTIDRSLGFSKAYRYRVRAHDRAGNSGTYMDGPLITPKLKQQNGTGVTYGGSWTTRSSSSASGGSTRSATKAGAWVQYSFTGRAVAVVAPKGSSRGSAKVYVDGTYAGTISAYRGSSQSKIVLFSRNWGSNGSHKVKLVVVGTAGHPRFDIDAFAYLK